MRRAFDERELETSDFDAPEPDAEREFTLGSVGLLIVLAVIVGLCLAFFALGYAAGHRRPTMPVAAVEQKRDSVEDPPPIPTASSKEKPSATPQGTPAPQPTSVAATPSADPDGDIVGAAKSSQPATSSAAQAAEPSPSSGSQPLVRPAIPVQPPATSAYPVSSPISKPQGIMVQIAAVSHAEDADVLINALRRRGYAVTAHRDLGDNLIHVQVGPFTSRADANAMKLKLLNDGYNAIVEP